MHWALHIPCINKGYLFRHWVGQPALLDSRQLGNGGGGVILRSLKFLLEFDLEFSVTESERITLCYSFHKYLFKTSWDKFRKEKNDVLSFSIKSSSWLPLTSLCSSPQVAKALVWKSIISFEMFLSCYLAHLVSGVQFPLSEREKKSFLFVPPIIIYIMQ